MNDSRYAMEQQLYAHATRWCQETADLVLAELQAGPVVRHKSGPSDTVSSVDHAVHDHLVARIQDTYPDHHVISEEGTCERTQSRSPYTWVIDPIDGTNNLLNRRRDYAVSVAVCRDDQPVIGVVLDVAVEKLYTARAGHGAYLNGTRLPALEPRTDLGGELIALTLPWRDTNALAEWSRFLLLASYVRGIRNYGASTIELCDLAAGGLGAVVQHYIRPWDYLACKVLLSEVGASMIDWNGQSVGYLHYGSLVAASGSLARQIVRHLTAIDRDEPRCLA